MEKSIEHSINVNSHFESDQGLDDQSFLITAENHQKNIAYSELVQFIMARMLKWE